MAAALGITSSAAALPDFSTDNASNWLYISFDINNSIIEDLGAGQRLRNRLADESNSDAQLWKLTGRADSCVAISRRGNYMHYVAADNRFESSASDYTVMELVASTSGKWELHLADKSQTPAETSVALVINGGSGLDRELDLWKHDFNACALNFIKEGDIDFEYQPAPQPIAEVNISPSAKEPEEPLSLWYDAPATNWVKQALPIGAGDFGAMIFGGIAMDRIQFNHKTLWRGSERTADLGTYLSFGDLYLRNLTPAAATDYRRDLNLRRAEVTVSYQSAGSGFERRYLASYPDKVIAVSYTSSTPGALNYELQLINAQGRRATYTPEGAAFSGTLDNGMHYAAAVSVGHTDGTATATKSGIRIEGASEITIYLACATDFDPVAATHMTGNADSTAAAVASQTASALAKGFTAVETDHTADYRELFDRVDFEIAGSSGKLPTPTLLNRQGAAAYGARVDMLVFQYGRYLTIASSRGVALPSNLQGIWCKDGSATSSAVWASDIHSNINVQMNYWPAEPTNLSECHLPFLDYITNEANRPDGTWQKNARDLGVDEGWVVNTAGNIFGGSSNYKVGKYSVVNAWYCEHLWQHYTYNRDIDRLRSTTYPLMKSACRFWFKRLQQGADGLLECPNEYSPEQGRIQNATAHAQQLVAQLFINTLAAIRELGSPESEKEFAGEVAARLEKLDRGLRIDANGLLREWKYQDNTPNLEADGNYFANDEANVWQCHRHTSHLMALYPGFEIDPGKDPDIFNAAVASLNDRGDVATGWARAWRISLWARARNAARAYTTLRGYSHHTEALSYDWHGGIYDNMLDAHATTVFQIEGNFGATAGIAEMLLQSRPDSIVVLPALPKQWADGHISGLKTIGNFTVDLEWADGKLKSLQARSGSGRPLTLAYPGIEASAIAVNNQPATAAASPNLLTIPTNAGDVITITPGADSAIDEIFESDPDGNDVKNTGGNTQICDLTGHVLRPDTPLSRGIYLITRNDSTQKIIVK